MLTYSLLIWPNCTLMYILFSWMRGQCRLFFVFMLTGSTGGCIPLCLFNSVVLKVLTPFTSEYSRQFNTHFMNNFFPRIYITNYNCWLLCIIRLIRGLSFVDLLVNQQQRKQQFITIRIHNIMMQNSAFILCVLLNPVFKS